MQYLARLSLKNLLRKASKARGRFLCLKGKGTKARGRFFCLSKARGRFFCLLNHTGTRTPGCMINSHQKYLSPILPNFIKQFRDCDVNIEAFFCIAFPLLVLTNPKTWFITQTYGSIAFAWRPLFRYGTLELFTWLTRQKNRPPACGIVRQKNRPLALRSGLPPLNFSGGKFLPYFAFIIKYRL